MTLKGKVAIVTGGNTGIGRAVVLALAKQAPASSSTTSPTKRRNKRSKRRSGPSVTRSSGSRPT